VFISAWVHKHVGTEGLGELPCQTEDEFLHFVNCVGGASRFLVKTFWFVLQRLDVAYVFLLSPG